MTKQPEEQLLAINSLTLTEGVRVIMTGYLP